MHEYGSQSGIIKEITLSQGMEIDVSEAWRKLISSQFGGSPGRGFGELIQNFLDSYPASTPWEERRGEIRTTKNEIILVDFGEGMNRQRLKLMLTLGGTDKMNDVEKIGTFGVGFFSIFNPSHGTEKVVVTTRCEGHVVEMMFKVLEHGKRPEISTRILDQDVGFSTKIHVMFDNSSSPKQCLEYARQCLIYYPCKMTINGARYKSVWETAEQNGLSIFKNGSCDGMIDVNTRGYYANVLCKYEHIMDLTIPGIVTGGHFMKYDLRDYKLKEMPCLEQEKTTINSNALNVTISRDSFKMDYAYKDMVEVLRQEMLKELLVILKNGGGSRNLLLANQYIFANGLGSFMRSEAFGRSQSDEMRELFSILLDAKLYSIEGRKGLFSLHEMHLMKTEGLPLFFSTARQNLNWLSGAFKNDFIVLPSPVRFKSGAPDFFDSIFNAVFRDCVNLDTIKSKGDKIRDLVQRGIVPGELLEPNLKIAGERELSSNEQDLISELGQLFSIDGVRTTICNELHTDFQNVRIAFFEFNDQGTVVATGLFDEEGNVLKEEDYQMLEFDLEDYEEKVDESARQDRTVLLGLNRNSELIRNMLQTNNADRSLYILPILANELTLSQKWLTPYSSMFNLTRENLASGIRKALLENTLGG